MLGYPWARHSRAWAMWACSRWLYNARQAGSTNSSSSSLGEFKGTWAFTDASGEVDIYKLTTFTSNTSTRAIKFNSTGEMIVRVVWYP